jgi:predicted nucleic acid-binding protein
MKTYFLDTSIFISAFWKKHPNFESSFQLMSQSNKYNFITSNHSLVEYYSVMTRLPIPLKIEPSLVYNLITENITPHVNVFGLTDKENLIFLKQASILQIQGWNIYDYYHFHVAQKRKADAILTWNTKDFLKFGEEIEIKTPNQLMMNS